MIAIVWAARRLEKLYELEGIAVVASAGSVFAVLAINLQDIDAQSEELSFGKTSIHTLGQSTCQRRTNVYAVKMPCPLTPVFVPLVE